MGIYDRDYYKEDRNGTFAAWLGDGRACRAFILFNIGLLLAQIFLPLKFTQLLALQADGLADGQVWRLLTGGLIPLDHPEGNWVLSFIFHMLFIWWFGVEVEERLGSAEFLGFVVVAALAGCAVTAALIFAGVTQVPKTAYITCAAGPITAILVLAAIYNPRRTILLFFVLPVPIWALIALTMLYDLRGAANGSFLPVGCHLGAAAFAFIYYQFGFRLTGLFERRGQKTKPRPAARPKLRVFRTEETAERDPDAPPPPVVDENLEAKVDALLEKVARHGQESLTTAEREVLFRASEAYKRKRRSP